MDEIRLEIIFDNHLIKKRALLDNKKSLFGQVAILKFFQRGNPMNLVQNEKTTLWSAFGEICLEIMFDDHLVKNRALLDYKKSLFGQVAILELFQRGDPMNLVQN